MYSVNWTVGAGQQIYSDANVLRGAGHTGVSSLSGECHQRVLVQASGLVVGGLQDRSSSHRSLGGGDQGEVLAGDAQ